METLHTDHAMRVGFSRQELKAFELGQRMADASFSMDDNPFDDVQPRLARRWLDGFIKKSALSAVASSLRSARATTRSGVERALAV